MLPLWCMLLLSTTLPLSTVVVRFPTSPSPSHTRESTGASPSPRPSEPLSLPWLTPPTPSTELTAVNMLLLAMELSELSAKYRTVDRETEEDRNTELRTQDLKTQ